jgi:hypothetical protein
MGLHSRPKSHACRNTILTTTTVSGLLVAGSSVASGRAGDRVEGAAVQVPVMQVVARSVTERADDDEGSRHARAAEERSEAGTVKASPVRAGRARHAGPAAEPRRAPKASAHERETDSEGGRASAAPKRNRAAQAAPASTTVAKAARTTSKAAVSGSPRVIARALVADAKQFTCFSHVIDRESRWKTTARNPSSGAYGIPQALPARKMASAGSDWRTNPRTQISWALSYMNSRYGSPCGAWSFWQSHHWY